MTATPAERLSGITVFCAAAEHLNFRRTARALGMTPSGVGKAVARLEGRLGVRLLNRTTRSVSLTDDGRAFYERCRVALTQLGEAEAAVLERGQAPRGRLRVSLPLAYGRHRIAPRLPAFVARYPAVELDVDFDDRVADLARDAIDVAVRTGDLRDSGLVARRLEGVRFVTCAAPAYLAAHGTPRTVDDLADHVCLRFVVPNTRRAKPWQFTVAGTAVEREVGAAIRANNAEALIEMALAGGGIVQVHGYLVEGAIATGQLVRVLPQTETESSSVSVLYPPNRQLSPKVRAFVDFLVDACGDSTG